MFFPTRFGKGLANSEIAARNAHFDAQGHLRTAHHEGKCAYYQGKPTTACPYRTVGSSPRISWFAGWDEADAEPIQTSRPEFPSYEDGGAA